MTYSIDFSSGDCVHTIDDKLYDIEEKLKVLKNPYTGNKRQMIKYIFKALEDYNVPYDNFLDLFAGSCTVSIAAKWLGCNVMGNDLLTFSYLIGKAFFENDTVHLNQEEIDYLLKHKNKNKGDFVYYNYGLDTDNNTMNRFTREESIFLDNFRANVDDLFGRGIQNLEQEDHDNFIKKSIALCCMINHVISHCFVGGRLNQRQVLADANHRIQHARNSGRALSFRDVNWADLRYSECSCNKYMFNMDVKDFLDYYIQQDSFQTDLCYIDPPYGGEQSNYSKMYRFFEEYIHIDRLDQHTHYSESGAESPLDYLKSNNKFSHKKSYEQSFNELLKMTKIFPYLAISYNNSSWADINKIVDIVKEHRDQVDLEAVDYTYGYRTAKNSKRQAQEYLIIAK